MNWKKWLGYNLYKKLWSLTPINRPFTFWLRDLWHKSEFIWIVGLVSLGVWLGHNFEWRVILSGWLIFSLGYLVGHLFWGKEYIPDEKGE